MTCKETLHATSWILKMNLLICVSIIGLVQANSTPSTPNVTTASTESHPAITGNTTQTIPAVTGNTNRQSSLTNAGPPLPTTASSDKSKISDNSIALESGIIGIIGTQDAVNLEVRAKADTPTSGSSVIKESGKVAEKTGTNSDDTGIIENTNVKPNSVATDNINQAVLDKTPGDNKLTKTVEKHSIDTQSQKNDRTANEAVEVNKLLVAGEINLDIVNADKKREEVVAAGVENVDMMQHSVDLKALKFNLNEPSSSNTAEAAANVAGKPKKCNVKNSTCVPTREELVAAGVENVDMMQHSIDLNTPTFNLNEPSSSNTAEATANIAGEPKKCNVKNSTCVPTREELVAAGVENVDMMQHSIDLNTPTFNLNEPSSSNTAEATANIAGEPKKCNVKNSTCVPTREELVAAGVQNVDMMQHSTDPKPTKFNLNEPYSSNTAEAATNVAGEPKKCNVKNSTCVPTREELVAAGVENVDMMQHRIDLNTPKFNLNEPSSSNTAEATANIAGEPKKCNVKNSTCVPTREELVAAGVDNVDMMQHRIDPKPPKFNLNEPSSSNTAEATANIAGEPKKCNVKNSTCVPTREELVAAGVENVDMMQHRIDLNTPKFNLNEPSSSNTANPNADKAGPGCNVKNGTCVPSEKELIAAGVDMSVPRQFSIDTENHFLGQIPKPSQTTQQTKNVTQQTEKQTTEVPQEFQTCPNKNCRETCVHGRKVNSKGCETCKCKFSNNCPRVTPTSRLLCLLRAMTSQNCSSDNDCRRNRICCPGTCGPSCRRTPRSRSMLLSMLAD